MVPAAAVRALGAPQRFVARPVPPELPVLEHGVVERAERLLVQVPEVVHVDVVLDEELPVEATLDAHVRELRQERGVVAADVVGQAAQGGEEVGRVGRGVREHHALPLGHRGGQQPPLVEHEVRELLGALGHDLQPTVQCEPPPVIGAGHVAIERSTPTDHHHAAVPAEVVERTQHAVLGPHEQQFAAPDLGGEVAAGGRERRRVGHEGPRVVEQEVELAVEPRRVGVGRGQQQEVGRRRRGREVRLHISKLHRNSFRLCQDPLTPA